MRPRLWKIGLCLSCVLWACACANEAAAPEASSATSQLASADKPRAADDKTPVDEKTTNAPPVRLFASKYVSKIRSAPNKDAPRLGYMRGGAVLSAKTHEPLGFDACRKGWFELETGGFVCSTTDVIAFQGKRLPERRATQPSFDGPLPYPYGYARSKNTPVYRRLPTDEEAALYEGYKIPGAREASEASPSESETTTLASAVQPSGANDDALAVLPPPAPAASPTSNDGVAVDSTATVAAGMAGLGEVDIGPPTLASLQGEAGTVLMRRMERGFYVSLDREIAKGPRQYWQTQASGYIPKSRLMLVEGSKFRGASLAPDGVSLPVGFVLTKKAQAYSLDPKGRLRSAAAPAYQFMFPITGEADVGGKTYYLAADGKHYPTRDVTRIAAREKPAEVAADEKWIDVDLTTQSLVAYVGDTPVYATLISSGRVKDDLDPLRNFVTPVGSFRVTSKHLTATMDGDHSIDGPYSIEDVPYVMYFQLAYALHSAFWHNGFGRPRSHGCINLAPTDAKWLFFWAAPGLPPSWHGVFPTAEKPGTRLYIRGETPKG